MDQDLKRLVGFGAWDVVGVVDVEDRVLSGGYDAASAERDLEAGKADLIAVEPPLLANPDLVERWKTGAPLNPPDTDTFYTPGAKGYTYYPVLATHPADGAIQPPTCCGLSQQGEALPLINRTATQWRITCPRSPPILESHRDGVRDHHVGDMSHLAFEAILMFVVMFGSSES